MKLGVAMMVLMGCGACGGEAPEPEPVGAEEPAPAAPALCYWRHPEGCPPCPGQRDYGAGNTCEDVIWKGRSETDFCLQTYRATTRRCPLLPSMRAIS
jgi:hypothetical protein